MSRPHAPSADHAGLAAGGIEAILFDVDGTLYRARRLRASMLTRLVLTYAPRPATLMRTARIISAYRRAHEQLRTMNAIHDDLAATQVTLAALNAGLNAEEVATCVERWMQREPLDLLARAARHGLDSLISSARDHDVRLAAVSDYPAADKLRALGIDEHFDTVVSAQDADVQCLKPQTRGLELALHRLGVEAGAAIYVGDRPEVDAAAAANAGMRCVIIGAGKHGPFDPNQPVYESVNDFEELEHALFH